MHSLNELISNLSAEQIYQFSTTLLHHLNDREWCESRGLNYNSLPYKDVQLAKWATYREITLTK